MTLRRGRIVAAALGIVLLVAVAFGIFWFGWDWKALIGWRALVDYINPNDATGRKDAVQVYALMVAGVVAAITAAVGLLNLRLTRRNLEQQRELEDQRAHETALQNYIEAVGELLIEKPLREASPGDNLSRVVRAQTLSVLEGLDPGRKRTLLLFLHESGLIREDKRVVSLAATDLREANLRRARLIEANLTGARLTGTNLSGADIRGANLSRAYMSGTNLGGANLSRADIRGANLKDANLSGAILNGAILMRANVQGATGVTSQRLERHAYSLQGAIMPDGSKHP